MRSFSTSGIPFTLLESLQSLATNPLRSALSITGVVFGVASVVAMLGIGMGAEAEIEALLDRLGARNIHITAHDMTDSEWQQVIRRSTGLSERDEHLVSAMFDGSPLAKVGSWTSHKVNRPLPLTSLQIYGMSPNFRNVLGTKLAAGRSFTAFENLLGRPVALVGEPLARQWFGDNLQMALGQQVRIDQSWFHIIGVLASSKAKDIPDQAEKPTADSGGQDIRFIDIANALVVPLESAGKRLGPKGLLAPLERLILKLGPTEDPTVARKRIASTLRRLHRGANVVDVTAADEIIEQKKSTTRLFSYFLLTIALISLVVGGIGIANVMLAGMVERIREVGLRRAIGAKRHHILYQFLTEALAICLIGGLLGGLLGLGVAWGIGIVTGWSIAFPWWGLLVALLISTLVGLGAGLYPALSASRISPIEALQGRA